MEGGDSRNIRGDLTSSPTLTCSPYPTLNSVCRQTLPAKNKLSKISKLLYSKVSFLKGRHKKWPTSIKEKHNYSASLIIMEMQIKTTMTYHVTHFRMVFIRKMEVLTRTWKKGLLVYCWWYCKISVAIVENGGEAPHKTRITT